VIFFIESYLNQSPRVMHLAKELGIGEGADLHNLSLQLNYRELVCARSPFPRI